MKNEEMAILNMSPADRLEHDLPFDSLNIQDFANGVKQASDFLGKDYVTIDALAVVFNTPAWEDLQ